MAPTPQGQGYLLLRGCAREAGLHALVAITHHGQGCLLLSLMPAMEVCLLKGGDHIALHHEQSCRCLGV